MRRKYLAPWLLICESEITPAIESSNRTVEYGHLSHSNSNQREFNYSGAAPGCTTCQRSQPQRRTGQARSAFPSNGCHLAAPGWPRAPAGSHRPANTGADHGPRHGLAGLSNWTPEQLSAASGTRRCASTMRPSATRAPSIWTASLPCLSPSFSSKPWARAGTCACFYSTSAARFHNCWMTLCYPMLVCVSPSGSFTLFSAVGVRQRRCTTTSTWAVCCTRPFGAGAGCACLARNKSRALYRHPFTVRSYTNLDEPDYGTFPGPRTGARLRGGVATRPNPVHAERLLA